MDINNLLKNAVNLGASDLHISVGFPPIMRIDGLLKKTDAPALTKDDIESMINDVLTVEQKKLLKENKEIDLAYEISKVGRFRTNIFYEMKGTAAAFRIIPQKIMTLEEMDAPDGVYKLVNKKKGLVLVTGPTGSGKSTTLAAMINYINHQRKEHIITIEDPIEYVHNGMNCLINQREIGAHSHSFAEALRSALREDPDVILVGEMRDLETIALAVTAAETGHLVLATLHTSSAPETVDRVIDVFSSDQQNQIRAVLSNSIEGVIAQKLVPKRSGKGRIAVMEIMIATSAIRNLIRERKAHQINTAIQTSTDSGMQSMDQSLMSFLNNGHIDLKIAKEYAIEKKPFEMWKGTTRDILHKSMDL